MAERATTGPDERPTLDFLRHAADLSRTDRALIEILQLDGRRPLTEIAREVGVSEKTARRRMQQLIGSGVIQITALTDPVILGYRASAQVGVRLDGSSPARDVARELGRIERVDYVVVAAGRFPLYVEVLCPDQATLLTVVDETIRRTPGVRDVELFPYLSIHYQQAQFSGARRKSADAPGVRPNSLDRIDRQIVRELSRDGRAPFLSVAATLGVSESQVRQRFKRLSESGVVKVLATINPMGLEYRTMAWLCVRAAPEAGLGELAEAFARLRFVTYVAISAGRFDLFVEVICVSPEELLELLDREVRPLPGLGSLETSLYQELHYKPLLPIVDDELGRG